MNTWIADVRVWNTNGIEVTTIGDGTLFTAFKFDSDYDSLCIEVLDALWSALKNKCNFEIGQYQVLSTTLLSSVEIVKDSETGIFNYLQNIIDNSDIYITGNESDVRAAWLLGLYAVKPTREILTWLSNTLTDDDHQVKLTTIDSLQNCSNVTATNIDDLELEAMNNFNHTELCYYSMGLKSLVPTEWTIKCLLRLSAHELHDEVNKIEELQ